MNWIRCISKWSKFPSFVPKQSCPDIFKTTSEIYLRELKILQILEPSGGSQSFQLLPRWMLMCTALGFAGVFRTDFSCIFRSPVKGLRTECKEKRWCCTPSFQGLSSCFSARRAEGYIWASSGATVSTKREGLEPYLQNLIKSCINHIHFFQSFAFFLPTLWNTNWLTHATFHYFVITLFSLFK